MVWKDWPQEQPPMFVHYGVNKGYPMHRIITIPVQIVFGILLIVLLVCHFHAAMCCLFFIGIIFLGSIFGSKPKKRRTATGNSNPQS